MTGLDVIPLGKVFEFGCVFTFKQNQKWVHS